MSQAIGFMTDKAPSGGYRLCQITSMEDGQAFSEVIAYRSTLAEVQAIELARKSELFGEPAWVPVYAPEQTYQRPVQPPPVPMPESEVEMPHVVSAHPGHVEGLVERMRHNGSAQWMVPVVLALIWGSAQMSRWVV